MIATIIAVLISIGYIGSPTEYYQMSPSEQQAAHVIVEDIHEF